MEISLVTAVVVVGDATADVESTNTVFVLLFKFDLVFIGEFLANCIAKDDKEGDAVIPETQRGRLLIPTILVYVNSNLNTNLLLSMTLEELLVLKPAWLNDQPAVYYLQK